MKRVPKDSATKDFIQKSIKNSSFLKHMDESQMNEMISFMYKEKFKKDQYIIKQGDSGKSLYIMISGTVQVSKDGEILGKPLGAMVLFGELAILYNCTRTASVKALEDVEVWTIERTVYQKVMRRTGNVRREEHARFLKSVPIFKDLHTDQLLRIVDVAVEEIYHTNDCIIREGERGDTFFVIIEGNVRVMQNVQGKNEAQKIRTLAKGAYFGEKALLSEDVRTASILAEDPGVKCLIIERETFMNVIGGIKQIADKDYGDKKQKGGANAKKPKDSLVRPEFQNVTLDQYEVITTLGMGGFGRVELVSDKNKKQTTYALKCLSKKHVVATQQQEHIFNEKDILLSLDSNFIIKLFRTFKDKKYVYLLMEVCLGGEIWTILRDRDTFDENTARFYTACVVEAFDYIHGKCIVFRDLKPENLLMDDKGYIKIVDFGFAKKLTLGKKTYTFCGTPEYVAPEIILNKGHDTSSDLWSLGILIFELLTGNPPFASGDPMQTYNQILKGIDSLDFPSSVSRGAKSIIKSLCRDTPSDRLGNQKGGYNDVRKHKWFQGFHWKGLATRTLPPPIKPKIKSPSDTSNFDEFPPEDSKPPPDETSGWDKDF